MGSRANTSTLYLRFVLVPEVLVAELALDVLDLQVGRVDVALQVVGLHEPGAAVGAEIRSTEKSSRNCPNKSKPISSNTRNLSQKSLPYSKLIEKYFL